MTPSLARSFRIALAAFALVLSALSVVFAQARVVVEVRSPGGASAEGEIVLTAPDGRTYSCRTSGGACDIADVPGGQYVATLRPTSGDAPPPRSVMIPPSGRVTLHVSTH